LFTIDVRALAALRVSMAVLILIEVATRVWLLPDFYTDAGVVPRSLTSLGLPAVHLSVHMWSGGLAWAAALHALLAVAAVSLLLGWRTRIATVVVWLLLVSLHLRNWYLVDGGDRIMDQLLFWSMFLPLGAVYSLDARRRAPAGDVTGGAVLCWAGAGLMLQITAVYMSAGLSKLHGAEWLDGTAVAYVVRQDLWAHGLAFLLQGKTMLTTGLTYAALVIELVAPFALFSPFHTGRCRIVVLVILSCLQAGLAASIDLGLFPFVAMAALLPFVPAPVWDEWLRRLRPHVPVRATERRDIGSPGAGVSAVRYARDGFLAAVVAFVVWDNLSTVSRVTAPSGLEVAASAVSMAQGWHFYAPSPGRHNLRLTVAGLRSDSTVVTLDDWGETTSWRPLERFREDFHSKEYLEGATFDLAPAEIEALGAWVCRTWNGSHGRGERVIAVAFRVWKREIRLDGSTAPPERSQSPEVRCLPPVDVTHVAAPLLVGQPSRPSAASSGSRARTSGPVTNS